MLTIRPYRALCSAIIALAVTALSIAQRQNVKKPLPLGAGVLSGRAFGITEGGDLKPARLANVYLIFEGSVKTSPQSPPEDGTAGWVFNDAALDNFLKAEKATTKILPCRQKLLALDQSIKDTTEWVLASKKPKQLLFADADEEGYFRILNVPAGRYKVEARGQAGANDASWSADITVNQGEEVSLKLASPGLACPVLTPSE